MNSHKFALKCNSGADKLAGLWTTAGHSAARDGDRMVFKGSCGTLVAVWDFSAYKGRRLLLPNREGVLSRRKGLVKALGEALDAHEARAETHGADAADPATAAIAERDRLKAEAELFQAAIRAARRTRDALLAVETAEAALADARRRLEDATARQEAAEAAAASIVD